jgi:hypothetical protein
MLICSIAEKNVEWQSDIFFADNFAYVVIVNASVAVISPGTR